MRILLAGALALLIVPVALATAGPRVRLAGTTPATVAGTGFHARERIVVTVSVDTTHLSKAVVSTARGTFVARFARDLSVPQCSRVAVSAVGARGDRAAWKTAPESCGAPPQP